MPSRKGSADTPDLLKLGLVHPMPRGPVREFLKSHGEVLVLEELDDFEELDEPDSAANQIATLYGEAEVYEKFGLLKEAVEGAPTTLKEGVSKDEAEEAKKYMTQARTGFGSQIRNYFLHPDQRVKDARTGHYVGNFNSVLDGSELQGFLDAFLRWKAGKQPAAVEE